MNAFPCLPSGIVSDPEILGGTPVFAGTRVPAATMFEHFESGCSLDEIFEWFPAVKREAAVEVPTAAGGFSNEPAGVDILVGREVEQEALDILDSPWIQTGLCLRIRIVPTYSCTKSIFAPTAAR